MNCDILRTLYVKSNGEILCNDDYGERVSLGWCRQASSDPGIYDVLNNAQYQNIRDAFTNDRVPWPGVCEKCSFFRPDEPHTNDLLQEKIIEKIQFEASLACALKCPMCSNLTQIQTRGGGRHFTPEMMAGLLQDLKDNDYQIRSLEYCGQGEPLNNPRFPELLAVGRRIYPDTLQRVITNGNHDFVKRIGSEFVEETLVSIDGAFQESYEKYRVKGDISKAFEFMRDAIASQKPRGGLVIWKYVLFETNDSEEELLEAQRLSQEFGVTRLWFVHSHTENRSKKYTYKNPHAIPIHYPNIKIDSHPSYFRHAVTIVPDQVPTRVAGDDTIVCLMHIDRIVIHSNGSISIAGWANSQVKLSHVTVVVDDREIGRLIFEVARPVVARLHPVFTEVVMGFDSLLPPPEHSLTAGQMMIFHLASDQGNVATFVLDPNSAPLVPPSNPVRVAGDNAIVCLMHIDGIVLHSNGSFSVSGWAHSQIKLSHVTVEIDNQEVGTLTFEVARPDVAKLHPVFSETISGFRALLPPPVQPLTPDLVLTFHLWSNKGNVASFVLDVQSERSVVSS